MIFDWIAHNPFGMLCLFGVLIFVCLVALLSIAEDLAGK
jgi:hypothetical protein